MAHRHSSSDGYPTPAADFADWKEVEAELGESEAARLRKETSDEVLSEEFKIKVLEKMSRGEPVQKCSRCFFVLGPSAAGKSHHLHHLESIVDVPRGAIDLDGAIMRECSEVWQRTVLLAAQRGLRGFSDFFNGFFKGPADKLKHAIVEGAIKDRANVVVPETASNQKHLIHMVDQFLDAGYQVRFVAIIADKHLCEERGRSREVNEGKKYSSKNWNTSIEAILCVQEHLVSRGVVQQTGNVRIFHNSKELVEVDLEAVKRLLRIPASIISTRGGWCETRLLAGIYSGQGGERIQIMPANFEDEEVDVKVIKGEFDQHTVKFNVTTCQCGSYRLSLDGSGRPALISDQGKLEQVESIPDVSLQFSLESVADVLQGTSFLGNDRQLRALTDEEYGAATDSCKATGPRAAPRRDQPSALFLVAPSGCGKTTCLKIFSKRFGINADEAVIADSSIFRDLHPQYQKLIEVGLKNGGIWYSAWPAVKKIAGDAKKKIVDAAMKAKQDVCCSDTGSDTDKLIRSIDNLKSAGFKVHMLGIFADPHEIISRGVARELEDGKRYNRDVKKLCKTFDSFAPAVQAINGTFCLVLNAQGKGPQLYREGKGGEDINFNLHEALASMTERQGAVTAEDILEASTVKHEDLCYIMEGNMNVVCGYQGTDEDWQNMVLRMRKKDNCRYRTDVRFAKTVAVPMLGSEYLDPGVLVALKAEDVKSIDEALLPVRPDSRKKKRLDVEVSDASGLVLAMKVSNLMVPPTKSEMITVELKPKCGLRERQGLPSRYKLLQYEKLNQGKIDRLSEYDPIKLFSCNSRSIDETLRDCMREPQNNIRIFINGKAIFDESLLQKSSYEVVLAGLDGKLQAAGIDGSGCLLSIVAGILGSPTMLMPSRLKRIQCWAAGETAHMADALLKLLRDHHGDDAMEILSRVENFELAVENLEDFPCDEEGIVKATEIMDSVLAKGHERWDADSEREVIRWICRFLLGRTAHDVSILLNFVHVAPSMLSSSVEQRLRRLRYQPLDFSGIPSGISSTDIWCRISVVDTDAKAADKIPEYATQLDKYAAAYFKRFEVSKDAASSSLKKGTAST